MPSRLAKIRMRSLLPLLLLAAACRHGPTEIPDPRMLIHGQRVPRYAVPAHSEDFKAPEGTAVLHYYGAGGWLIQWGDTVVLTAPYVSNFSLTRLLASRTTGLKLAADVPQLKQTTANTPIAQTSVILIGHGHVDHTADVPALFSEGIINTKPVLIADRSTTNQLAALKDSFSCIAPIDYREPEADAKKCPVPRVRITPVHHAHAPHLQIAGLDVAAFGGRINEPMTEPPSRASDYKLGYTWAYVIDLLDEKGNIAFRIHYVDAAGEPPHGLASHNLNSQRDVDVHIACVPGFEQTDEYPDGVLGYHHVKYALLAHWEDFLQPVPDPLMPLRNVLTPESIDRFIDIVEKTMPAPAGVVPEPCAHPGECGPRGATWAMPVPGETYRFATGKR
jgi:hypothetical protein